MASLLTHSKSFDLPAGAQCPATGIYVVTHRNPPHALPHEVLIAAPSVLPRCKTCADVRFSLMRLPVEAIHENEHFRDGVLSSLKYPLQPTSLYEPLNLPVVVI
jgi:hypothetical protein